MISGKMDEVLTGQVPLETALRQLQQAGQAELDKTKMLNKVRYVTQSATVRLQ